MYIIGRTLGQLNVMTIELYIYLSQLAYILLQMYIHTLSSFFYIKIILYLCSVGKVPNINLSLSFFLRYIYNQKRNVQINSANTFLSNGIT